MNLLNDTVAAHHARTACRWRYTAIGILSFALLGLTCVLDAKKPEKPEPPPPPPPPPVQLDGLLYYRTFEFGVSPYSMVWEYDAATGISRELFEIGGSASHIEPSEFDHNGRWFAATALDTLDQYPPLPGATNTRNIYSIFVGNEYDEFYVLIDDITFEVYNPGGGYQTPPVLWKDGDAKLLVIARYLTEDLSDVVPDSVGLYEIALDWSSNPPGVIGTPTKVLGSEMMGIVQDDYYGPHLNIASYDVSSDGTQVFYTTAEPEIALYHYDLANGGPPELIFTDLWRARYCDVTGEIVAQGSYDWGVFKVSADRTAITALVDPGLRIGGPAWSPAGTEVAYEFYHDAKAAPKCYADVRVISADDGTELADPSDVNGNETQVYGWVK